MTLYGVDISNNNGSGLDIAEIQGEGFSWVEAKVSQGNYFYDATWPGYQAQALSAGMPIVGYHYADSTSDPASQAAAFQANGGGVVAMIDFETNGGTITDYWALVDAFNNAGITIVLTYLPHWYWQDIGSPDLSEVPGLTSSSYPGGTGYASVIYENAGGDEGEGWAPYGNATPVIWQFTDQAWVDGTTLDANAFRGTQQDLTTLLGLAG